MEQQIRRPMRSPDFVPAERGQEGEKKGLWDYHRKRMATRRGGLPMKRTEPRVAWVDVLRGMAIMLVLLGHRTTLPGIREYINGFHIPLFFALSGYLYDPARHTSFVAFLKTRGRRLLVPYVFFASLSVPLEAWRATARSVPLDAHWLLDLTSRFFLLGGEPLANKPVWFLVSLFTVEMVYFWIARIERRRFVVALIVVTAILGYVFSSRVSPYPANLPLRLNLSVILLPFYGFGSLMRGVRLPRAGSPVFCALVSASIGVGLWFQLWERRVFYNLQRTPADAVLVHTLAICSIIAAFSLAQRIGRDRFLETLGRNTLLLFGAHYLLYAAFDAANRRFLPDLPVTIASVYVLVTTLAVILATRGAVSRYLPWAVGAHGDSARHAEEGQVRSR